MPKLPLISGDEAIRCFEKLGYRIVRQKGSHVRMHHQSDKSKRPLTIPQHKVLGKGLIRKLMRDADITLSQLLDIIK